MIRLIRAIAVAVAWFHRGLGRCLELRTPGCTGCDRLGCMCDACWRDGR